MVGWLLVVRLFRRYSRTLHYNEIDEHLNDVMGLKLYGICNGVYVGAFVCWKGELARSFVLPICRQEE